MLEPTSVNHPLTEIVNGVRPTLDYLARHIWNVDDRDDFVQDILVELIEGLRNGRVRLTSNGKIPNSYLTRLAVWRWKDYLKRLEKIPRPTTAEWAAPESNPEQNATKNELHDLLVNWLDDVLGYSSCYNDPFYSKLLHLRFGMGLSATELYRDEDFRLQFGRETKRRVDPPGTPEAKWRYYKTFEALLHRIKVYLRKHRPRWHNNGRDSGIE